MDQDTINNEWTFYDPKNGPTDPFAPPPWARTATHYTKADGTLERLISMTRFSDRPQSDTGADAWIGYETPIMGSTPLRVERGLAMTLADNALNAAGRAIREMRDFQATTEQFQALAIWLATHEPKSWGSVIWMLRSNEQPYLTFASLLAEIVKSRINNNSGDARLALGCLWLWISTSTEKAGSADAGRPS